MLFAFSTKALCRSAEREPLTRQCSKNVGQQIKANTASNQKPERLTRAFSASNAHHVVHHVVVKPVVVTFTAHSKSSCAMLCVSWGDYSVTESVSN